MKKDEFIKMPNRELEELYDLLDFFRCRYIDEISDQQLSKIVEIGNLVWSKRKK